MSQNEREDYDDLPTPSTPSTIDPNLKQAGTYWMIFWAWFLVPFTLWSLVVLIQEGPRAGGIGFFLIVGVISLAGAALNGSRNMRNGSVISFPAIYFGSTLFAIVGGGAGIFVGLQVIPDEHNHPDLIEQIQNIGALIWSLVFILIACNALYFVYRYRTTKKMLS